MVREEQILLEKTSRCRGVPQSTTSTGDHGQQWQTTRTRTAPDATAHAHGGAAARARAHPARPAHAQRLHRGGFRARAEPPRPLCCRRHHGTCGHASLCRPGGSAALPLRSPASRLPPQRSRPRLPAPTPAAAAGSPRPPHPR